MNLLIMFIKCDLIRSFLLKATFLIFAVPFSLFFVFFCVSVPFK